jgi:hypothetical protein
MMMRINLPACPDQPGLAQQAFNVQRTSGVPSRWAVARPCGRRRRRDSRVPTTVSPMRLHRGLAPCRLLISLLVVVEGAIFTSARTALY